MNKKAITAIKVLAAAYFLIFTQTQIAFAESENVLFVKGDCTLNVEKPHLSASLGKKSTLAVKANVTSTCVLPQQKLIVQIILQRKEKIGFQSVKTFVGEINNPQPNPKSIEIRDAFVICKNPKLTNYRTVARAWVTIGGKLYQSQVGYSYDSGYLKCGT